MKDSERLRAARAQAGGALRRAGESDAVQGARRLTGDALHRAGEIDQAKRAGAALKGAYASAPVKRASVSVSQVTDRVRHGELKEAVVANASNALAVGRVALRGQDGRPSLWLLVWLAFGLATAAATFLTWISIDLSQPGSAVSADIPASLLRALDRGYSIQEVAGLGFALTAVAITSAVFGALGYVLRRWYCWLVAAAIQIIGVALAAMGLLLAGGAQAANGWLVPAEWEPYAPSVTIGVASFAYLVAGLGFVITSVCIAASCRRARQEARWLATMAASPSRSTAPAK